jgi:hypothetical protein
MTFEFGSEFRIDTPLVYHLFKFLIHCALSVGTFVRKVVNINELNVQCQQLYFMNSCYLYKCLERVIMNFEMLRIPGPCVFYVDTVLAERMRESRCRLQCGVEGFSRHSSLTDVIHAVYWEAGLWSRYTKLPTPTPQFLKLRLFHKISIYINNGKPIRHFITTT